MVNPTYCNISTIVVKSGSECVAFIHGLSSTKL